MAGWNTARPLLSCIDLLFVQPEQRAVEQFADVPDPRSSTQGRHTNAWRELGPASFQPARSVPCSARTAMQASRWSSRRLTRGVAAQFALLRTRSPATARRSVTRNGFRDPELAHRRCCRPIPPPPGRRRGHPGRCCARMCQQAFRQGMGQASGPSERLRRRRAECSDGRARPFSKSGAASHRCAVSGRSPVHGLACNEPLAGGAGNARVDECRQRHVIAGKAQPCSRSCSALANALGAELNADDPHQFVGAEIPSSGSCRRSTQPRRNFQQYRDRRFSVMVASRR